MSDEREPAEQPGPGRASVRRVLAVALSAAAFLLVYLALALPRELDQLTPLALVRIPVELLLGVAILLLLPPRVRRVAAAAGGALLGVLTIVKVFDMGFLSVLGRPFDPVFDWALLGNAREFLEGSFGPGGALGATVAAIGLVILVVVATTLAMLRINRAVGRHRPAATRAAAVLSVAWVACLAVGAQLVAPVPVASRSAAALAYEKARQVPASLRDEREFVAQAAVDGFRATPPDDLLSALRGKDVVLTFIESYGRNAVEDPRYAPVIAPLLDAGTARLAAAGYGARSGWLTSPLAGGGSWMAHATFVSGLKVDNQNRYRSLVTGDRRTLSSMFRDAGWETTDVMPGTNRAWPEGSVLRLRPCPRRSHARLPRPQLRVVADARPVHAVGLRAPRARPDGPRTADGAARADLQPRAVDAVPETGALGRGRRRLGVRPQVEGAEPPDEVWKNDDRVREVYRGSTAYSLTR